LFTGRIRGDVEKRVIEQTKFWPHETTRTVHGHSTGGSSLYGTTSGRSVGDVNATGMTEAFLPDSGIMGSVGRMTTSSHTESMITTSTSSSTDSQSETTTEVPFYEYEPFTEVSSVQYYSIEEMVEKFISWIANQTPMHAQLKIGTRKPIPIVTPFVKDVAVREKDVVAFKEQVYRQYARPVEAVDAEIAERVEGLIRHALMSHAGGGDAKAVEGERGRESDFVESPVEGTPAVDESEEVFLR